MSASAPAKMTYRFLGWYDIMAHAFKSGVNYYDNAECYIGGKSEEIVGRAIQKGIQEKVWSREDLVISTKIHIGTKTGPNDQGLSRKHIVEGLKATLKAASVFCHRADDFTPIEEKHQWMPADIAEACEIADRLGLIRPVVEQPKYNIFDRPRVDTSWAYDVLALAYGVLSGKYTKDIPEGSRFSTELYNNIVPDFRDRVQIPEKEVLASVRARHL
ncbi:NADP-dependent oxidoreductase domain [Phytophthora cactorum]|nr:NADP-dependent oxidoreductase domain [Phytophthora cactorum]